ncbi:MAG: HEPN domain-containing protein [candidate division WOR-3 bacterium]|nr:HEPN domain-containing protein [candidate division WOR-3 bacterium]
MSEIASLIERAHKYLTSAATLLAVVDFESSVSRTYYAMFFAAEALLLSKGLSFSSHRGVLSAFGEHFVKTGVMPSEMGRELKRAFSKRQLGDYEYTFVVSQADAEQLLESGRTFVVTAADYLKHNSLL